MLPLLPIIWWGGGGEEAAPRTENASDFAFTDIFAWANINTILIHARIYCLCSHFRTYTRNNIIRFCNPFLTDPAGEKSS